MATQRIISKQLGGVEDLLLDASGDPTVTQQRASGAKTITKVHSGTIPHKKSDGSIEPISSTLESFDISKSTPVADRDAIKAKVGSVDGQAVWQSDIGLMYTWDSSKTITDDDKGYTIYPTDGGGCWVAKVDGAVDVRVFGAKGNGADNTEAIQSALNYADSLVGPSDSEKSIEVISDSLEFTTTGTIYVGRYIHLNFGGSKIENSTASIVFEVENFDTKIENLTIKGCNTAIYTFNNNKDKAKLDLNYITFSGNALDLKLESRSSSIVAYRCKFEESYSLLEQIACDKFTLNYCWVSGYKDAAVPTNYSPITIVDSTVNGNRVFSANNTVFVPFKRQATGLLENSWINMGDYTSVVLNNNYFGGEKEGGVTLINCDSSKNAFNSIDITDCNVAGNDTRTTPTPTEDRISCVRITGEWCRSISIKGGSYRRGNPLIGFKNGLSANTPLVYIEGAKNVVPKISITQAGAETTVFNDTNYNLIDKRIVQDTRYNQDLVRNDGNDDLEFDRTSGIVNAATDSYFQTKIQAFKKYRQPACFIVSINSVNNTSTNAYNGRAVVLVMIVGYYNGTDVVYKLVPSILGEFQGGSLTTPPAQTFRVEWANSVEADKTEIPVTSFPSLTELDAEIKFYAENSSTILGYTIKSIDSGIQIFS